MSVLWLVMGLTPAQWAQSARPDSFARVWITEEPNAYYAECLGARLRAKSTWLRAESFWLPALAVPRIKRPLDFVAEGSYHATGQYNYGESGKQQMEAIGIDRVHDMGYIGTGVRVGIFDTGFDLSHPSLRHIKGTDRIKAEHDFNSGDSLFVGSGKPELPAFPQDRPGYINSFDLLVGGAGATLVFAATSEDSLAYWASNRWTVYGEFGDSSGLFSGPFKISSDNFALRPRLAMLGGDTLCVVWQEGISPSLHFARLVRPTGPEGELSLGQGMDPQPVASGDTIYIFYYVDGDGLYETHSFDRGASFSTPGRVLPASDYWGAAGALFSGTPVAAFGDGTSVWTAYFDGSSWHTNLVDNGILPSLYAGDSLYLAYYRGDTLVFASAPDPSSPFSTRTIGSTPMPSPPCVGLYQGQIAVAAEDSSGTITVFGKSGSALGILGEEFSEKPRLSGGLLAWVRRGDPDASPPQEGSGAYHGTKTLSVIAGLSEGNLVGTAPGCDLVLAKTEKVVTADGGSFENRVEEDFWTEALEWATRHGARVINSSLGYRDWYSDTDMDGKTAPSSRAAARALSENVLVFNSMGNIDRTGPLPPPDVGDTTLGAPADAFGICAIGGVEFDSVNNNWTPSFQSAFGPSADGRTKPELVAPFTVMAAADTVFFGGTDTTFYLLWSGTSFSSALCAGAAASVWEAHPSWDADSLRRILLSTATPIPRYESENYLTGFGMFNAYDAINAEPPEVPAQGQDAIDRIYPNPFNPDRQDSVVFQYKLLHNSSFLELRVYTLNGTLVWQAVHEGSEGPGPGHFAWDGRTSSGQKLQPGLYLALLKTAHASDVARFMVIR